MKTTGMMYLTLASPIIAGILNMIWCKDNSFNIPHVPMDMNKNFIDGKRIFGNNKTWKGFFGYLVLNIICSIIMGIICNVFNLNEYNYFYSEVQNTLVYNILIGLLLGLGYSLFELPNSFLKRRLGIEEGKTAKGFKKYFFIFLDQADSVFGVVLVVSFFYPLSIIEYLLYVLLGAVTHILMNMLLYFMKLRKNMF